MNRDVALSRACGPLSICSVPASLASTARSECMLRKIERWTMRICVCLVCLAVQVKAQSDLPSYTVHRADTQNTIDGVLDEASWRDARPVRPFIFPWHESGEQEPTEARLLWDDRFLYVSFVASDQHISATLRNRDAAVSRDDAVEVFVAPDTANVDDYFNFEFNALGTILDRSPRDGRSSSWNAPGVEVAITIEGTLNDDSDTDDRWTTEIAIPFASFEEYAPRLPPAAGDEWRLNLYRIGGKTNPQFSVWSDTQTEKPQYHVPSRFGLVRFSESRPPSTAVGAVSLGTLKVGRRVRVQRSPQALVQPSHAG